MAEPLAAVAFISLFLAGCSTNMSPAGEPPIEASDEAAAHAFIAEHEKTVRPMEREAALAWWNANVTGREQDFQAKEQAQNRLDAALSDHEQFARLEGAQSELAAGTMLARQIAVLYLLYLEKQVDPELLTQITAKANAIEKAFNAYRANVERPR